MRGPLAGRTVVVTRPGEESEELARPLESLGARVLRAPAIRFEPGEPARLEAAIAQAARGDFAWVVFTSATGVEVWFRLAERMRLGPPEARIAAVGSGTAGALRGQGLEVALVPDRFTTQALGEAFPEGSGRVLLPRADLATPDLERALAQKGWAPLRIDAYRIRPEEGVPEEVATALERGLVDAVTFTSASTVEGFTRAVPDRPTAVCIGPATAEAARRAGFPVAAVADPHTIDGLTAAVRSVLGSG